MCPASYAAGLTSISTSLTLGSSICEASQPASTRKSAGVGADFTSLMQFDEHFFAVGGRRGRCRCRCRGGRRHCPNGRGVGASGFEHRVADCAGGALLAVIVDRRAERRNRTSRIIFLFLGVGVERGLDVGVGDRVGLVDRLAEREVDQHAAGGGPEAAAGREVRNVLDDVAGPDLQIIRVHVAARVAEILAARHRPVHRLEPGALFDELLEFRKIHTLISNRQVSPPVAIDSTCLEPGATASCKTVWMIEQTSGCSLTVFLYGQLCSRSCTTPSSSITSASTPPSRTAEPNSTARPFASGAVIRARYFSTARLPIPSMTVPRAASPKLSFTWRSTELSIRS